MFKNLLLALLLFPALAFAQITPSPNNVNGGLNAAPSNLTAPVKLGTPKIADTGVLLQATSDPGNTYNQFIIQNTDAGNAASANVVVNNNLGTATTYYGEFGMDSSTFSGSGSLNLANGVYLDAKNGDLALGTLTSNPIHFVVNNGATDAVTVDTSGNVEINTGQLAIGTSAVNGGLAVASGNMLDSFASNTAYSPTTPYTLPFLTLSNTDTTANDAVPIYLKNNTSGSSANCVISMLPTASGSGSLRFNCRNAGTNADDMTITATGAVGIGTVTPSTGAILTLAGHPSYYQASVPVVTSCGSGTAVASSTDNKGQITGITAATACTITFGSTMPPAPACTFSTSTGIAVGISAISTSAVTTSMAALTGTLYYICQ